MALQKIGGPDATTELLEGDVLKVRLAVKFRSFGITWGTVSRAWQWVIPPLSGEWATVDARPELHFDERGVRLDIWVE